MARRQRAPLEVLAHREPVAAIRDRSTAPVGGRRLASARGLRGADGAGCRPGTVRSFGISGGGGATHRLARGSPERDSRLRKPLRCGCPVRRVRHRSCRHAVFAHKLRAPHLPLRPFTWPVLRNPPDLRSRRRAAGGWLGCRPAGIVADQSLLEGLDSGPERSGVGGGFGGRLLVRAPACRASGTRKAMYEKGVDIVRHISYHLTLW